MRKLLRMSILTALLLIAAVFGGCETMQTAHAGETIPPPPIRIMQVAPGRVAARPYRAWWSDAAYRGMQRVSYQRYPIYRTPRTPVGSWSRTLTRGGLTHIIRYPVFVRPVIRTVQSANRTVNTAPVGRPVQVYTTGYDDVGITASGVPSGYGRVAVDPSIFAFGTKFWIPGYGNAVAADTGSGVHGLHLDVWFATASQCAAFTGYRTVYVLS